EPERQVPRVPASLLSSLLPLLERLGARCFRGNPPPLHPQEAEQPLQLGRLGGARRHPPLAFGHPVWPGGGFGAHRRTGAPVDAEGLPPFAAQELLERAIPPSLSRPRRARVRRVRPPRRMETQLGEGQGRARLVLRVAVGTSGALASTGAVAGN